VARVTGPLFSLDARGSLWHTLVYSAWKGLNYVRMRVVPYNAKSDYQKGIRAALTYGVSYWKSECTGKTPGIWWNEYAEGTNQSGFNRFMKFFIASGWNSTTRLFTWAGLPDPE